MVTRRANQSSVIAVCCALAALLAVVTTAIAQSAPAVDNSTLTGKLIMGYQGWFGCPDPAKRQGWMHWKAGDAVTVDMIPDTSELSPEEKCDSGLRTTEGRPIYFFDSGNPKTVDRHFAWMQQYEIPGVALQKFASQILRPETQARADLILHNVKQAAEAHGRVFFLMYDLSGTTDDKLDGLVQDWIRLNRDGVSSSRAYLRHKGHPVLGLWGIGFNGRPLTPGGITAFIDKLRAESAAFGGVTFVAGVPAGWRTGTGDGSDDPGWKNVWPRLDVISPWTVGRYADDRGSDNYRAKFIEPDLAESRSIGVDYMPVIFPGFSWSNLMRARHLDDKAVPNQIPRRCGAFYWRQARNVLAAGANMAYNAMFDEVDEGTAMFKTVTSVTVDKNPTSFVTIDADSCAAPNDLYLELAKTVSRSIQKGTQLPISFTPIER
ncbi:glycoside hydrolase family 71/99-like protein [Bradyrhizobium sp. HKCCYLR20261]|uniref:glycoside hydrolase family 71/99-like protein n=1 Tax=Bradyrhizobium sp. HKCCYLR20261 TaxID=3420760 RepID=UPI003EBE1176